MTDNRARSPKIGIIGAGQIGKRHLAAWQRAGAEVRAVADVVPLAAKELAAGIPTPANAYEDPFEMLDVERLDLVSICTPPSTHAVGVEAALQRGVGVLCEKPIARDLPSARRIAAAHRRLGGLIAVGFCHRYSPEITALKATIEGGELGTIVSLRNRFAADLTRVDGSWFANPEISGGGSMMDTSPHSIDLFRFLVGEPTHISAQASRRPTGDRPELAVEHSATILLQTSTGALGVLESSWRTPAGGSRLEVYGTAGTAIIDYGPTTLTIQTATEQRRVELGCWDRFDRQAESVIESWRTGADPRVGIHDGIAANAILDAAYRAIDRTMIIEPVRS